MSNVVVTQSTAKLACSAIFSLIENKDLFDKFRFKLELFVGDNLPEKNHLAIHKDGSEVLKTTWS